MQKPPNFILLSGVYSEFQVRGWSKVWGWKNGSGVQRQSPSRREAEVFFIYEIVDGPCLLDYLILELILPVVLYAA